MHPTEYMRVLKTVTASIDRYRIIGIDPGETTGIVIASVNVLQTKDDTDNIAKAVYVRLDSRSEKTQLDLADAIITGNADVWVIENFRLAPYKAKALSFNALKPARVIGMLEYLAEINNVDIVFQNPAEITKVRVIAKDMFGWKTKHEHDAGSHVMAYISKRENVPVEHLVVIDDDDALFEAISN